MQMTNYIQPKQEFCGHQYNYQELKKHLNESIQKLKKYGKNLKLVNYSVRIHI